MATPFSSPSLQIPQQSIVFFPFKIQTQQPAFSRLVVAFYDTIHNFSYLYIQIKERKNI